MQSTAETGVSIEVELGRSPISTPLFLKSRSQSSLDFSGDNDSMANSSDMDLRRRYSRFDFTIEDCSAFPPSTLN